MSHFSHPRARPDRFSFFDRHFRKMKIGADDPFPMVDHHHLPFEDEPIGENYFSVVHRKNRRSSFGSPIDSSVVSWPRFPVNDSLFPIDAFQFTPNRPDKRVLPETFFVIDRQGFSYPNDLFGASFLVVKGFLLLGEIEDAGRIVDRIDPDFSGRSGFSVQIDVEGLVSGRCISRDSCQAEPVFPALFLFFVTGNFLADEMKRDGIVRSDSLRPNPDR